MPHVRRRANFFLAVVFAAFVALVTALIFLMTRPVPIYF